MYELPTRFHVSVTNKCQLNCKQCYAIRNDDTMTAETLDLIIDHVDNIYKMSDYKIEEFQFTISGGEVGLYDPELICNFIDKIHARFPNVNLDIECVSNLIYTLTDKHLAMFDKATRVSTSFDIGTVRYSNPKQKKLWYDNAKTLLQRLGEDRVEIFMCLTSELINKIGPEELMDIFYMLPFTNYELHRLSTPIRVEQQDRIKDITPSWREVNKYLYKAFVHYLNYRPHILITTFESIMDSFQGNNWYDYSRRCQEEYLCFYPNEISFGCAFCNDGIVPINTPTEEFVFHPKRIKVIEDERIINEKCNECRWKSKCRGGCNMMPWQGDDCPTPYLIYEYLDERDI